MHSFNMSTGTHDDVVLVRWPEQRSDAERLALLDKPHLLLVEPGAAPPEIHSCVADWIRLPADDGDVRARLAALAERALRHPTTPTMGDFGEFNYHGRRVLLSPVDERVAELLIASFDRVVTDADLIAHVWQAEEGHVKLRVHISRLRKRVAELGLEITVVRNIGYRMHAAIERHEASNDLE